MIGPEEEEDESRRGLVVAQRRRGYLVDWLKKMVRLLLSLFPVSLGSGDGGVMVV